jgi:hypothetical protein
LKAQLYYHSRGRKSTQNETITICILQAHLQKIRPKTTRDATGFFLQTLCFSTGFLIREVHRILDINTWLQSAFQKVINTFNRIFNTFQISENQ